MAEVYQRSGEELRLLGSSDGDSPQMVRRVQELEGRFDATGRVKAGNLPLSDAVNSATGTLAASDTAVKTAYDKAVSAASAASTAQSAANAAKAESATAARLKTARGVDGVNFDGSAALRRYAGCATAAGTAAKTVDVTGFSLVSGALVCVRFTNGNTSAAPTLNVSGTGAKPVKYRNAAAGNLKAESMYLLCYDGEAWEIVGDLDSNSTYTAASAAPRAAGTAAVGTSAKYAREDHVHPAQTSVSGNAGTATKLATARGVDGVSFDGSGAVTHYATCATAAGTAAKAVSLPGFVLGTGSEVTVRFTVTNTAASPTLNVNNTGAKPIQYRNAAISAGALAANRTYRLVYDGSSWEIVGDLDSNTTYGAASTSKAGVVQLSSAVNSTSETLAATAKAAKTAYDKGASAATAAATAQSTANTAKTTADAAKTAASTAQSTANTAKTTASAAVPRSGARGSLAGSQTAAALSGNQTISITSSDAVTMSTRGALTLTFTKAATNVSAVKTLTLTASAATTLKVSGAVWANAGKAPTWGSAGKILVLAAHFTGGRVVLHVLDNTQA